MCACLVDGTEDRGEEITFRTTAAIPLTGVHLIIGIRVVKSGTRGKVMKLLSGIPEIKELQP